MRERRDTAARTPRGRPRRGWEPPAPAACGGEKRIGAEMGMLHNLMKRQMACMEPCAGAENITGMQRMIVHYLAAERAEGDCFQRDLENRFRMRRSTATGILQLMEQHGLIRREPVERDARLKRLVLTERAYALHDSISSAIEHTEHIMRAGISAQELDIWFAVCEKIRANLEDYQRRASEGTL